MSITRLDELARVRAELDHLVGMRSEGALTVKQQRRYDALASRERELLGRRPIDLREAAADARRGG